MNQQKGNTPQERAAYKAGYEHGAKEGMKKAALLIQLMSSSTDDFEECILQNSNEARQLRKIFTEKGE